MSSLLKSNLDKSLSTVPAGQHAHFFLNADGSLASSLKTWIIYLIHKIPFVQSYYDPIVTNIVEVFSKCVDDWTALKNNKKFQLTAVDAQEFSDQIKRICFASQFILANCHRIEAHTQAQAQICSLLADLLPGRTIALPQTLQELTPITFFPQLDIQTIWKMEEEAPPLLTEVILRKPPPLLEAPDSEEKNPSIGELPDFYLKVVQRIENPRGRWMPMIKDWWAGRHQAQYQSLKVMCATILEDKDAAKKALYHQTKLYLGKLLALFKTNRIPDLQVKICLDELVHASKQCAGEWTTEAERRYKALMGKEETPQDKAIQWKAQFIDQHLMQFFRTVYTSTEDAENVHLMNTLLYHYGERLGRQDLEAPKADIHVIKKATSLPYQWPDIYRYLVQAWRHSSVEAFKTYIQMKCWTAAIGQFLIEHVKQKISSVKDPQEFVMAEYFDEMGNLNNRGAVRFLRETLF